MKTNMLKLSMVILVSILVGAGVAFAGGYKSYSNNHNAQGYSGYHHGGHNYYHHQPYYRYHHGYGHPGPYYYGPPVRYYNHRNYYYRGCDRYDGGYYFSGAYTEPGFGFVFGTRGSW
jgi:hypothetical protein